jgi:DNA-binding MarR family transcriptional regulator
MFSHRNLVILGLCSMDKEDLHILRLMGEIERGGSHTQRELSRCLNLSLGLVNTFIKRLVNKGYFKVKTMPRNRVKYFLTPEGLARKSKLTVEYLKYSVNFYREIKDLLVNKFKDMERQRINSILFLGAGEVAELAYLYLQITDIELVGIIDERQYGKIFFGLKIDNFDRLSQRDWDVILLTRLDDTDRDIKTLVEKDVNAKRIMTL